MCEQVDMKVRPSRSKKYWEGLEAAGARKCPVESVAGTLVRGRSFSPGFSQHLGFRLLAAELRVQIYVPFVVSCPLVLIC